MKAGISSSRSCATTPSHSRMRSPLAQDSRTTRRYRRSALMPPSPGHSCRRRITSSGTRFIRYRVSRCSNEIRRLSIYRRSIVHAPELEGAPSSALELDDHIQLLPVLRAEIVLRDLPATRDLALDHEIAALPVALDLDVPASFHYLG